MMAEANGCPGRTKAELYVFRIPSTTTFLRRVRLLGVDRRRSTLVDFRGANRTSGGMHSILTIHIRLHSPTETA